ncbi:MAG: metallophosphoesterase [Archangium sp.]
MNQIQRVSIVVLVSAVVALGGLVSAGALWRASLKAPWLHAARVFVGLLVIGVLLLLYGVFIEADWLEVTHVTVKTKKYVPGKTFRIAHISDLHVDENSRAISRLTDVLRKDQPDVIIFTGDSINEREAAPLFRRIMSALPATQGRFAVRGNHDTSRWADVNLFDNGPATELNSEFPVIRGANKVAICGAPFNDPEVLASCLYNTKRSDFTIAAFHTPDLVESLSPQPDLYLAGHTHGGQIALPFYGAVLTFSKFDKKYEGGRYQVGDTTLYVNRGIGFEPHLPKIRLFARPELTLIDVVGE